MSACACWMRLSPGAAVRTMILSKDWREFIESLNSRKVEYVLVGGHAVAYHGRPRFTDDLDFVVRRTPENAQRLLAAIQDFVFGSLVLPKTHFLPSNQLNQLVVPPHRLPIAPTI